MKTRYNEPIYITPEYDPPSDINTQPIMPTEPPANGRKAPPIDEIPIKTPRHINWDNNGTEPLNPSELSPPDSESHHLDCSKNPLADPKVRFLHAAPGYEPLRVSIGSREFSDDLHYGMFTDYVGDSIKSGYRTVTVTQKDEYDTIVYQGSFPFMQGEILTLAVTSTEFGIDVVQKVENMTCPSDNAASVRFVNLCFGSPALDLILIDRRVVFTDVSYKVATKYRRLREGYYDFFLAYEPEPNGSYLLCELLASAGAAFKKGKVYTLYLIGRQSDPETLAIIIYELKE